MYQSPRVASVPGRRPELRWLGSALLGVGVLILLGSQLYLFVLTIGLVNAAWGLIGVLALFFIPPLWVVAPFIAWISTGQFPATYFVIWIGGWILGGVLTAAGRALHGDSQ